MSETSANVAINVKANVSQAMDALGGLAFKFNMLTQAAETLINYGEKAFGMAKFTAEVDTLNKQFARFGNDTLVKMTAATEGSVDKITLMRSGLKMLQGDMALTVDEMELVLKAANNLSDQGFGDMMDIANDLTKAMKTGVMRSIKEHGIIVEETSNKQKALNELINKMFVAASQDINVEPALKELERLQAGMSDWLNDFKYGLGEILQALISGLKWASDEVKNLIGLSENQSDLMAEQARWYAKQKTDYDPGGFSSMFSGVGKAMEYSAAYQQSLDEQKALYKMREVEAVRTGLINDKTAQFSILQKMYDEQYKAALASVKTAKTSGGKASKTKGGKAVTYGELPSAFYGDSVGWNYLAEGMDTGGGITSADEKQNDIDKFIADMGNLTSAVGATYSTMTEAVVAGVDAAITGNEAIGKSMVKVVAIQLKTIAVTASVKAMEQTAYGLAALAFGPIGGISAGGYFTAAAQFAAVAVAAGTAAAGFGQSVGAFGGGSYTAHRGAAGGYVGSTSGGGGTQTSVTNIYIDRDYTGDPYSLAEAIEEKTRKAKSAGRIKSSSVVTRN